MIRSVSTAFRCASMLMITTAAFLVLAAALSQQSSPEEGSGAGDAAFSIGEKLEYRIEWDPPWYFFFLPRMDAGDVFLSIPEEIDRNGRKAVTIEFKAKSSGTLANLTGFKIDDDFRFVADAATLCSISSSMKQREGKRKRDIEVVYLPQTKQLHIHEADVAVNPPVVKKDAYKDGIPECVQDIFSALYWLRRQELNVGMKFKSVLGYGDRVKEVESIIERIEWVETPLGRNEAFRMNTVALMGGLFKDGGQFKIWLSVDRRKLPLQFEVNVSLGKVVGKLRRIEG
ncbi:MAG: hypothetical protein H6Q04_2021 [Acidobacteria bacterium]|nr:hypothetical protein [Acidobacteriota bacterium]